LDYQSTTALSIHEAATTLRRFKEMEVLIIHLSDIHLKDHSNVVLDRIGDLRRVLQSFMKEFEACFVVISGDLAFSGKMSEYELGFDLIALVDEAIRSVPTIATHDFLILPGNHDCDLSKDDRTRELVSRNLLAHPDECDDEMLRQCLKVQEDFEQFKTLVFDSESQALSERLRSTRIFNISGEQIVFDLYNTAWLSRNPESIGALLGPPDKLLNDRPALDGFSLRIALLHHPLHWIKPESSRILRGVLEDEADLILTGHEHAQSQYGRAPHDAEGSDYIEGGVLQESKEPDISTFNTLEIDLTNRKFVVREWGWGTKQYEELKLGDPQPFRRSRKEKSKAFVLTDTFFNNYLKNPGAQFSHPRKDRITFDDLYTPPDFRRFGRHIKITKTESTTLPGARALEEISQNDQVVISGNEKVGKTSAIKSLYWTFYSSGKVPVLISGNSITKTQPDFLMSLLKKAYRDQYANEKNFDQFTRLDRDRKVVFIDDFHQVKLSTKGRKEVLRWLGLFFEKVFIIGDDALRIEQLSGDREKREVFSGYSHYQILEFGYLLREKLVSRWILLGGEDVLEDTDYSNELKQKTSIISKLLGKNVVPSYPLFILVILQQMEAGTSAQTATGSFGYFYESLITGSLGSVIDQKEVDTHYNLIAELAYSLYLKHTRNIARDEFFKFITYYNAEYRLRLNPKVVEQSLLDARILFLRGSEALRFQYKYVYYYFIARHAAHNLSRSERDELIDNCVDRIHTERSANIVIFLSYLARDPDIIARLVNGARKNYEGVEPCDFASHVEKISSLQKQVPRFILPDGDPESRRAEALSSKDTINERTTVSGDLAHDDDDEVDFDDTVDEILSLNRALKSMQVLGQIVRNFAGSMKGGPKLELASECVAVGLRSINYMFSLLQENIDDVVGYVREKLEERNSNSKPGELEERAKLLLFMLCESAASALTRRIATDVGSPDLTVTYEEMMQANPTVSFELVDLAIKMDCRAEFPADEVIKLGASVEKNVFAKALLCEMVTSHFYLFRVDYSVRQRVCSKLGIGLKEEHVQNRTRKRLAEGWGHSHK
jgi:hypothetical protein